MDNKIGLHTSWHYYVLLLRQSTQRRLRHIREHWIQCQVLPSSSKNWVWVLVFFGSQFLMLNSNTDAILEAGSMWRTICLWSNPWARDKSDLSGCRCLGQNALTAWIHLSYWPISSGIWKAITVAFRQQIYPPEQNPRHDLYITESFRNATETKPDIWLIPPGSWNG